MITSMQMTVPRCTECSSLMMRVATGTDMYYRCCACNKLVKIIGRGKLDGEILVADNIHDQPCEDDDANLF